MSVPSILAVQVTRKNPCSWQLTGRRSVSPRLATVLLCLPSSAADLPPLPMLISPFLALIRSPLTTGPITSHALAALLSLLTIFPSELPADNEAAEAELTLALSDISSAVTHCKFEASDSQGDEVVLLKILEVLDVLVKRWGGRDGRTLLGDREVCEMLETGLGMCCQMRLSGSSLPPRLWHKPALEAR